MDRSLTETPGPGRASALVPVMRAASGRRMGITFREAVAEVELGLVLADQLADIATAGLLEGYESPALAALAGQFGEPYDSVEAERLWSTALQELNIPFEGRTAAAKILVRAYARQVADGELPPQLGASKIAGLHRMTSHPGCDIQATGDCIGAAGVISLFYTHDGRGYLNPTEFDRLSLAIVEECRRLAEHALRSDQSGDGRGIPGAIKLQFGSDADAAQA